MKKLYLIICVVLCMALALCACGGDETPNSTPSSIPSSVPDSTPSSTPSSTPNSTPSINPDSTPSSTPDSTVDSTPVPTKTDYIVKAKDCFGNEMEVTVLVEMFKDGVSIGQKNIRRGQASFNLDTATYTFKVTPMEGEFYYDEASCVLTPDAPEMTVTLYTYADKTKTQTLYELYDEEEGSIDYNAVLVQEGAMYVEIDRPAMSYFIFTPTRSGIYRFSYESSAKVNIGYFGAPHLVFSESIVDVVDGVFQIQVLDGSVNTSGQGGTAQYVIGISSYKVSGCVLKIERIGDCEKELEWNDIQVDKNATSVDNYLNNEIVDFDVTDKSLKAVFNTDDGYYHLNTEDGPIIYVRLSSAVILSKSETEGITYKYLPSFVTMCSTDRLGKVFYEDEKIVAKESYNTIFEGYAALCGSKGIYPLNEQLATAIKNTGDYKGWYKLDTEFHIFGDDASKVVEENAWLFACCYENENVFGTSSKPAVVAPSAQSSVVNYAILAQNGVDFTLRTVSDATLTISNAEGITVVANNGTVYTAEDGKISVLIVGTQNFTITFNSQDVEERAVNFTFVEYVPTPEE